MLMKNVLYATRFWQVFWKMQIKYGFCHNNGCCLYFLKDFHKMRGGSNFHHKKGDVCKIGGGYFKKEGITLY